ncbi:MAG: hypothetical protein DWQ18_05390 [Crenarchaeota archaeon]|mgnify:CR=1 FL=1|nr:MAG: hypothetical protein DWQ17_07745 [Thermoproteota archaeon]RDJ33487.1 MAG: hypothetical protein DWQ18_05390 [Thermoproteota archaeon]RDJ34899.1 MAG: hypothetical protein DWQ19_13115 [Thermoproteota archaeon]RDJ38398.1 MAG: hypothetical protein DWQ13_03175 [Thermoproteota archaeon]
MNTTTQTEWFGKKLLSMMIIAGVSISGVSFFVLDSGMDNVTSQDTTLCDNGLCYDSHTDSIPVGTYVQQHAEVGTVQVMQKTEDFSSLKLFNKGPKYEVDDFTATIYPAKDSFVREGIRNSNEGSNDILRVMGQGETNNRALIAFNQNDLEAVTQGKSLKSATLKLFVISNDGKWSDSQTINIHALGANWDEGKSMNAPFSSLVGEQTGVTWDCSTQTDCASWNGGVFNPAPTAVTNIDNSVNGQWIEFDVTGDIEAFLSGMENNGWIIMKSNEDQPGRINFAAREAQSNTPQLELTFA